MSQKPMPHLIHISSSDESKLGSLIVLEMADDAVAIEVAQKLALETGRHVTVRDGEMLLIETIPAAIVQ
jgi:hypothetical protein